MPRLPKVILFGDSLTDWSFEDDTYGFGAVLTDHYSGRAEVVNQGIATILPLLETHADFIQGFAGSVATVGRDF